MKAMLDPSCDIARRVWVDCEFCEATRGLYLLDAQARFVFVQCGSCYERYWLDTNCGVGKIENYVL
jgi:transcription elongation factor Elf1